MPNEYGGGQRSEGRGAAYGFTSVSSMMMARNALWILLGLVTSRSHATDPRSKRAMGRGGGV